MLKNIMNVLNISKYQSLKSRIDCITAFIVVIAIPYILAGFPDIPIHLIGYFWIILGFLSMVSYTLLSTKFYYISLLFWILLIGFLYFCIIIQNIYIQKEMWLLFLSTLVFYFLYKSVIDLRIFLNKWSLVAGTQYRFINLTYSIDKVRKPKFTKKPVKLYLFQLSLLIFYILGLYLAFIVIDSDLIIAGGIVTLISTIALRFLYFIRDIERKVIRESPKVKLDEQEKVITILRSHLVDDYKLLMQDEWLTGYSELEFIVGILESCMLPIACLTIEEKKSKYSIRFPWTSKSDEKTWLEFIENNLKNSPLIILILGYIKNPDTGKDTGLRKEIELIDKLGLWNKTLLIIPPIQKLEELQKMWELIKNNIQKTSKPNLKISEKTLGFMFEKDCTPKIELQSEKKDRSSFEHGITIAGSILLK